MPHSPLPFALRDGWTVVDAQGRFVLALRRRAALLPSTPADADLVVRACNHFDALLRAARDVTEAAADHIAVTAISLDMPLGENLLDLAEAIVRLGALIDAIAPEPEGPPV